MIKRSIIACFVIGIGLCLGFISQSEVFANDPASANRTGIIMRAAHEGWSYQVEGIGDTAYIQISSDIEAVAPKEARANGALRNLLDRSENAFSTTVVTVQ